MKNIFVLYDNTISSKKYWLSVELERLGYAVTELGIESYNSKNRSTKLGGYIIWMQYFILAARAFLKSHRGDIIVSWNCVVGGICAFMNSSLRLHRKVVVLNLIIHEKGFINTILRKIIYGFGFSNLETTVTVNSVELKDLYNSKYKINFRNSHVLSDVFDPNDEILEYSPGDGSIFCGGDAQRDWNLLIEVARKMPHQSFVFVARKKYFPADLIISSNVQVIYDAPHREFYSMLKSSSIVALPLKSMVTAGLIVLIKSALFCKPVIITRTPSTQNYIKHASNGFLIENGDIGGFIDSISLLSNDVAKRKNMAYALQSFIVENYSPKSYANKLKIILE